MAARRDKIVIQGGEGYYPFCWAYLVNGNAICSSYDYHTHSGALRSARRFAAKFINPPPVIDEKE